MRRAEHISDRLFKTVVKDRAITAASSCKIAPGTFPLNKTLHIAPGWNFVAPMNLRCAQHFAAEQGKILFLIPAEVKQVWGDKQVPDRVLHDCIFLPNSNKTGGRLGLLPLCIGMEVELLTKLGGEVNLLKGAKGIVEDIVTHPDEPVEEWAAPSSAGNRRGWVALDHFPIVLVRFHAHHDVKGVVPGDSSLIAIGPSVQTVRGRADPWKHTWQNGTDSRNRVVREYAKMVSCNLSLRPTFSSTTTGAQGMTALWAGLYAYPTGKSSYQEYVDDVYVELSRPKNVQKLVWHDPPPNLKDAMEAGPSTDSKMETRRLQERWLLTLPKAEAAAECMGWPALGEELCKWRHANFRDFEAELRREASWVASITSSRAAARDAAAAERGAAAAAARGASAAPSRAPTDSGAHAVTPDKPP
eukprot:gene17946-8132_t